MLQVDISSTVRTVFGKGPMRQLRMDELTPANLYGAGGKALALQCDSSVLYKKLLFIHGRNAVVTLQIEGDDKDKRHVLVREIQKEPTSGSLVHVDFQEINLETPREFLVPIEYTGTAKGVDLGGDLQVSKTEVKLKGRPLDIPEVITVDLTPLEKGGAGIKYADLPLGDSLEMLDNVDTVCVCVI